MMPKESKYTAYVNEYAGALKENPKLTASDFCVKRGIPYFEFCRNWALSDHYRPILAMDKRFTSEGERAVDNLILSPREIKFLRMAKAVSSPIRLSLMRSFCSGPKTVKDFILESRWAYSTAIHAIQHLERLGIVQVVGTVDSFNLYELVNAEAVVSILGGIEMLSEGEKA
jgi:hypothetical protein